MYNVYRQDSLGVQIVAQSVGYIEASRQMRQSSRNIIHDQANDPLAMPTDAELYEQAGLISPKEVFFAIAISLIMVITGIASAVILQL